MGLSKEEGGRRYNRLTIIAGLGRVARNAGMVKGHLGIYE